MHLRFRSFSISLALALSITALAPAHLQGGPLKDCLWTIFELPGRADLYLRRQHEVRKLRLQIEGSGRRLGMVDVVNAGIPLDEVTFDLLKIPKGARSHYDAATGRFNYRKSDPLKLALENGDARLGHVRLGFDPKLTPDLIEDYRAVLLANPDLHLWVVTAKRDMPLLEQARGTFPPEVAARIQPVQYEEKSGILPKLRPRTPSKWTQDSSKPLEVEDGALRTAVPSGPIMPHKQAEYLSTLRPVVREELVATQNSLFRFEGGNVIVGKRHIFVGSDIVEAAMEDFRISRIEAREALSAEFGKPVYEIGVPTPTGRYRQHDFHIDLTMAVVTNRNTGKETVLMASPRRALEVLLGLRKGSVRTFQDFSTMVDLARKQLRNPERAAKWTDRERYLLKLLTDPRILNHPGTFRGSAYGVARNLARDGYEVVEIPTLNIDLGASIQFHDPVKGSHGFKEFYANYTNAIFSGDQAMIPELALPRMDQAVQDELRQLGYRSSSMRSAEAYFCYLGGPRCAAETFRQPVEAF